MNIVEWLQRIMVGFGAAWIMWLMLVLSVISVAIILERAWYFWSLRDDLVILAKELRAALDDSIEAAQRRMAASPSVEAAVVSAGLAMADRGPAAAEEAMAGAVALQRMKLERRLAYLGTLGNNAPFIGLFGTVIGVVAAFAAMGQANAVQSSAQSLAPQAVMSSIGEALAATAVGLFVAIPAVVFNNYFQRLIKSTLANTDALSRILLAHLKSEPVAEQAAAPEPEPEPKPAARPALKAVPKAAAPAKGKKPAPAPKEEPRDEGDEDEEGEG